MHGIMEGNVSNKPEVQTTTFNHVRNVGAEMTKGELWFLRDDVTATGKLENRKRRRIAS